MRILTCLTVALLGAAGMFVQPPAACAESDQAWQACISTRTAPDDKITACSAVIEARRETGKNLAAAYCFRGHGLTEKRELDAALSDLNESIRLDPASACVLTNRDRVYAFKHDLDRAIADYDEAIRIDPGLALAYNNRGDAWMKGDLDRAVTDFSAAIKYNPSLAIAYGNRGYAFHRKRDMARAIADYTVQIKLKPDVLAYINRGNAYRDSEQLERAAADYGEVIKLAPTDARGWRNRGMIRLYQGDTKRGLADYDMALQFDPADAYPWNNRGQAKMRLGDKAGAIADVRKALEISPGSVPPKRACNGSVQRNRASRLARAAIFPARDRRDPALQAGAGFLRVPLRHTPRCGRLWFDIGIVVIAGR